MTDINPELIEKALQEFTKPRMHTNMSLDGTRAKLTAALSAVADDLRAEGAAQALEDAADRLDLTGLERNSELSRWDYYDSSDFYEELVTEWLTAKARADIIQQAWNGPNVSASTGTHAAIVAHRLTDLSRKDRP